MAKLAEELNAWFAQCVVADSSGRRRERSTAEVAEAISADHSHDVTISRSYLASLRSGAQTNPTIAVAGALVSYFRPHLVTTGTAVSVSALIGEPRTPSTEHADDPDWSRLLADRQIQSIAMRAGNMTAALRQQVLMMMDVLDPPPRDPSTDA